MKKIEEVVYNCWSVRPPDKLSKETIIDLVHYFKECVGEKLSELNYFDQVELVSVYLHLIGYSDQEIFYDEEEVRIKFELPGPIQISGLAVLNKSFEQLSSNMNLQKLHHEFLFVCDFHTRKQDEKPSIPPKISMIYLEDCIRVLSLILIIQLYRFFEIRFKQKPDLREWFFDYVSNAWESSREELTVTENRWNAISELKIEKHFS